jgi:hypothetical protein
MSECASGGVRSTAPSEPSERARKFLAGLTLSARSRYGSSARRLDTQAGPATHRAMARKLDAAPSRRCSDRRS